MTRAACLAKLNRIAADLNVLTTAPGTSVSPFVLLSTVATSAAELRDLLPELGRALAVDARRVVTSGGTVKVNP